MCLHNFALKRKEQDCLDVEDGLHSTRAGARAVDLGRPSVYRGGQSLKLSTIAPVFKRLSLLVKGGASMSIWGGQAPPLAPVLALAVLRPYKVEPIVSILFRSTFEKIYSFNFCSETGIHRPMMLFVDFSIFVHYSMDVLMATM